MSNCPTVVEADCAPQVVVSHQGPPGPVGPAGTDGSVVGPATSVADRIATFADTSGDVIKDSGVLLSDLAPASALTGKVDKIAGKGLSKNDFTDALKTKLDALISGTFVGYYTDSVGLIADWPTAPNGSYAITRTVGTDASIWIWDELNLVWVEIPKAPTTSAEIQAALATDTDWNKFSDTYKAKVDASVDTATFNAAILAFSGGTAYAAVVDEPTTARVLSLADPGLYIRLSNAAACDITIENDATVTWLSFPEIRFRVVNTAPTFTLGAGVTLNGMAAVLALTADSNFALKRVGPNVWDAIV